MDFALISGKILKSILMPSTDLPSLLLLYIIIQQGRHFAEEMYRQEFREWKKMEDGKQLPEALLGSFI